MRANFFLLVVIFCIAGTALSEVPLIYEGDVNIQGAPMAHGGRPQWDIPAKVGNTGRVRLNTYSGTNVFDPSSYTVTFNAGPTRNDAGQIELVCTKGSSYIEFVFSTNTLAYPFGAGAGDYGWYSSLKIKSGSTQVSTPEGLLHCYGAPEIDGGSVSFTYHRNRAL